MLEHRFKGKRLWSRLIWNISRKTLHYLADKADRAADIGTDKSRCGCLSLITFRLPCACAIALKIKKNTHICLDEIHTHWKRLRFEYEGDVKDRKEDISLLPEWDLLQVFSIKTVYASAQIFYFLPLYWVTSECITRNSLAHFGLYNPKI